MKKTLMATAAFVAALSLSGCNSGPSNTAEGARDAAYAFKQGVERDTEKAEGAARRGYRKVKHSIGRGIEKVEGAALGMGDDAAEATENTRDGFHNPEDKYGV